MLEEGLVQTEQTGPSVDMSREDAEKPRRQGFTSETARQYGQQPGQPSRNPKGRPKGVRYLSEAFRFWLAANNELSPGSTNADEIAAIVGAAALGGDLKAVELLLLRTEGKAGDGYWALRESSERIERETKIYERMDEEQLDYDAVLELIEEEAREEIQELLRDQKRQRREQKAQEKRLAEKIAQSIADAEVKKAAEEARRKAEEIKEMAAKLKEDGELIQPKKEEPKEEVTETRQEEKWDWRRKDLPPEQPQGTARWPRSAEPPHRMGRGNND